MRCKGDSHLWEPVHPPLFCLKISGYLTVVDQCFEVIDGLLYEDLTDEFLVGIDLSLLGTDGLDFGDA
jgi:hypothetical protein